MRYCKRIKAYSSVAASLVLAAAAVVAMVPGLAQAKIDESKDERIVKLDGATINGQKPVDVRATRLATNYGTSVALTSWGRVYTWGEDRDGSLGNGGQTNCDGNNDADCYNAEPIDITGKFDEKIINVYGEGSLLWAFSDGGDVYVWGTGSGQIKNRLDGGQDGDFTSPRRIAALSGKGVKGMTYFRSTQVAIFFSDNTLYVCDLSQPTVQLIKRDISGRLRSDETISDMFSDKVLTSEGNLYRITNDSLLGQDAVAVVNPLSDQHVKVKQLAPGNRFLTTGGTLGQVNDDNTFSWYSGSGNTVAIASNNGAIPGGYTISGDGTLGSVPAVTDSSTPTTVIDKLVASDPVPAVRHAGNADILSYVDKDAPNQIVQIQLGASDGKVVTLDQTRTTLTLDLQKPKKAEARQQYQDVHRAITVQNVIIICVIVLALIAVAVLVVLMITKRKNRY